MLTVVSIESFQTLGSQVKTHFHHDTWPDNTIGNRTTDTVVRAPGQTSVPFNRKKVCTDTRERP